MCQWSGVPLKMACRSFSSSSVLRKSEYVLIFPGCRPPGATRLSFWSVSRCDAARSAAPAVAVGGVHVAHRHDPAEAAALLRHAPPECPPQPTRAIAGRSFWLRAAGRVLGHHFFEKPRRQRRRSGDGRGAFQHGPAGGSCGWSSWPDHNETAIPLPAAPAAVHSSPHGQQYPGAQQGHLLDDRRVQDVRPEGRSEGHLPFVLLRRKIGVLGLNGSGKSTLLRILAGVDKDFQGQISLAPGYTTGFLPQEPRLDETKTVRQIVEEGMKDKVKLVNDFNAISDKLGDPELDPDEMEKLLEKQGYASGEDRPPRAVGPGQPAGDGDGRPALPPGDTPVKVLSGGEQRRVALSRLLLQKPDVLILDEPTNHLDAERHRMARAALRAATKAPSSPSPTTATSSTTSQGGSWNWTAERGSRGRATTPVGWSRRRRGWRWRRSRSRRARATLQRELEWVRQSPRARQAKSKRVSRRTRRCSTRPEEEGAGGRDLHPAGPRLGRMVIKAEQLAKGYGDRLLFENVNFDLPPGGIVGIIGPNVAGKTTLFRMVTDQEKPDAGAESGRQREARLRRAIPRRLADDAAVWQSIADGQDTFMLGPNRVNVRAYISRLGFTGSDQQQKVGTLSGGQRNRLHLARMLKSGANVILLDEPTNDLDVNTIRGWRSGWRTSPGAVVISHDRWFLDRVATHILAFEGDSRRRYEGNYQGYEEDRKKRLGIEAERPHRIKYRKLTK